MLVGIPSLVPGLAPTPGPAPGFTPAHPCSWPGAPLPYYVDYYIICTWIHVFLYGFGPGGPQNRE